MPLFRPVPEPLPPPPVLVPTAGGAAPAATFSLVAQAGIAVLFAPGPRDELIRGPGWVPTGAPAAVPAPLPSPPRFVLERSPEALPWPQLQLPSFPVVAPPAATSLASPIPVEVGRTRPEDLFLQRSSLRPPTGPSAMPVRPPSPFQEPRRAREALPPVQLPSFPVVAPPAATSLASTPLPVEILRARPEVLPLASVGPGVAPYVPGPVDPFPGSSQIPLALFFDRYLQPPPMRMPPPPNLPPSRGGPGRREPLGPMEGAFSDTGLGADFAATGLEATVGPADQLEGVVGPAAQLTMVLTPDGTEGVFDG